MGKLADQLNQILYQVELDISDEVGKKAHELQKELMDNTAIDSGRARSGWIVTEGEEIPTYKPPEKPKTHRYGDGQLDEFKSEQASNLSDGAVISNKKIEVARVTNNVEYINEIDVRAGGFVESAIIKIGD